jgi:hypothetical protein
VRPGWQRFRVPITVAAGAAAVAAIAVDLLIAVLGVGDQKLILGFVLLLGIGVFLFAMLGFIGSARVTRRSDVAFWLHLLAAPMIVHPVHASRPNDSTATIGENDRHRPYIALGITALAIDRRALLVPPWLCSIPVELFKRLGGRAQHRADCAVIGSALLLLSAFWHQSRSLVVRRLPAALQRNCPTGSGGWSVPAA